MTNEHSVLLATVQLLEHQVKKLKEELEELEKHQREVTEPLLNSL